MTDAVEPLDPAEEAMWRPFVHILNVLPRLLDTVRRWILDHIERDDFDTLTRVFGAIAEAIDLPPSDPASRTPCPKSPPRPTA